MGVSFIGLLFNLRILLFVVMQRQSMLDSRKSRNKRELMISIALVIQVSRE